MLIDCVVKSCFALAVSGNTAIATATTRWLHPLACGRGGVEGGDECFQAETLATVSFIMTENQSSSVDALSFFFH